MVSPVNYKKGFTLIEVLVAITIFSIAISLVSYAFRQAVNIVKYTNLPYMEDLQKLSRLRDAIKDTYFFMTQDDTKQTNPQEIFQFFFKGKPDELTFITVKPFIVKNREVVLTRVRKEKDSLIIEEYPVYDRNMDYKNPSFDSITPYKEKILDNLKNVSFEYFKNGKYTPLFSKDIPQMIKITLQLKDRKEPVVYYIKISSNAYIKKELGASMYGEY